MFPTRVDHLHWGRVAVHLGVGRGVANVTNRRGRDEDYSKFGKI